MRVTILGSGSSTGTPGVGLGWGRCDPDEPRNRRLRPSILVERDDRRLLVDTSPDLRQQLLTAGVDRLDAVLFTHGHADHLHGIDDLRPVNRVLGRPLDIFGDEATLAEIHGRFGYTFKPLAEGSDFYYKPVLVPHPVQPGTPFVAGGVTVVPFRQDHGYSETLGFRFGKVTYSTDLVDLPEESFAAVAGTEVWILGTLAEDPHPTHLHVGKALEWIARVKPRRAILSHLSAWLDYQALCRRLPAGVEPAYDGMVIDVAD